MTERTIKQRIHSRRGLALLLLMILLLQTLCGCGWIDRFTRTRVQWRDESVGKAAAVSLGRRAGAAVYFDELDQIRSLEIASDSDVDLTDLSGLPALESVDLSQARVSDYSPLLLCASLRRLRVGDADYKSNIDALETLEESVADTDIDVDANYWRAKPARFRDPVIEAAVREKLEMPNENLTMADTRHVDALTLEDVTFTALSDLENLVRLRELTLKNCGITSISPILKLTDLQYLNLENNEISSLGGIEALNKLQVLSVSHNQITDLAPLANLSYLFALSASGCPIEDVSVVSKIERLSNLSLAECGLQDLSFLEDCKGLSVLWLDDNAIEDLSPLSQLTSLTVLGLTSNRIRDLSPLSSLTQLTNLYLANNNVTDIAPLEALTNLTSLQLTMNNVSDVTPLTQLPKLEELGILSNPVTDYAPLEALQREWKQIDVDLSLARQATDTAQQIAQNIMAEGLSAADMVREAHDEVIRRTSYDHNAANGGELGFSVQSTYAALVRGQAVCVGYAEALAVICRQMGIEAYIVSGKAGGLEHAWTLVMLDGAAYYADPTWDDPDEGNLIYREFLLVDEATLRANHEWDSELFLPKA